MGFILQGLLTGKSNLNFKKLNYLYRSLHFSSAERSQRDAERPPHWVYVVVYHLPNEPQVNGDSELAEE